MKTWIFAGVLAVTALVPIAADAQYRRYGPARPPADLWCREVNDWGGNNRVCSAYTYEQCMAARYSHVETCYLNPLYDSRFRQRR